MQNGANSFVDAGPALRKDDPASLKEIVLLVLEREKKFEAEKNKKPVDPLFSTSRMRYMIEAIVDLKNNKAKPPPTAELIPQLKRSQKTIVGKRGAFLQKNIIELTHSYIQEARRRS